MTARPLTRSRLLGAGLVLAVALSVPIASRRDGQRVAGSAVAARTVAVPAVGDCVAALTGPIVSGSPAAPTGEVDTDVGGGDGTSGADGAVGGTAAGAAVVDESAVLFGTCAGTHVGEVAAFRRDPSGTHPAVRTAAAVTWCDQVGLSYREHLRWQVAAAGAWAPVDVQRFLAVVGTSAAGGWAVCAVLAPALEPYRGSYLDSMADRAAPAPFGDCRSAVAPGRRISCQAPHDVQVFGTARAGTAPTPDDCRTLVLRLTAMRDPTGDGRLAVEMVGSVAATCRVRVIGPQLLTATLLGRGDAPLPLRPG